MNEAKKPEGLIGIVRGLVTLSPLFFPAYLLRLKVGGVPFTVLEIYTYVLFGLWVLTLFRPKKFYYLLPLPGYFFWAAILFLGVCLGLLNVPASMLLPDGSVFHSLPAALGIWKGWVLAPLLYFVVLTQSLTNATQIKTLLRIFVYSAVLVALAAYGMSLFGYGITYDLRLAGFYESANYLALVLAPALLLNIVWVFERQGGARRVHHFLDTATLTVLLHALFFTQSYAAILSVFGALFLYALYVMLQNRARMARAALGTLVLLATLAVIVFSQLHTPKFQQFLDVRNRSSTTVRFEIYRTTWHLIEKNWLWGIGPGLYQANYQTTAPEVLGHAPMEWNIPHPHNLYFAFWLNAGLLGLLALLGFVWLAHRQFTYPMLAFWGILLHGFFDTPFWKNDLAMIFWLILGAIALLQSYGTHSASHKKTQARVRPRRRASQRAPAETPVT